MCQKPFIQDDADIEEFFDQLNQSAEAINPTFKANMIAFNTATASIEVFNSFVIALNESPYSITSNSVIPILR